MIIPLSPDERPRATQLFEHLELLSEGIPEHNTLFVLSRVLGQPDELLLVDPPADVTARFQLPERTAVLTSGPDAPQPPLPTLHPADQAVVHVQVGQHLLDILGMGPWRVVYLPAVGLLWSGSFGSQVVVPRVRSRLEVEMGVQVLRTMARIVRERRLQVLIPRIGEPVWDRVEAMTRLAEDLVYLQGLLRVAPGAARREEVARALEVLSASLLPKDRAGEMSRAIHQANMADLVQVA